jgi:hypothetical protein
MCVAGVNSYTLTTSCWRRNDMSVEIVWIICIKINNKIRTCNHIQGTKQWFFNNQILRSFAVRQDACEFLSRHSANKFKVVPRRHILNVKYWLQ